MLNLTKDTSAGAVETSGPISKIAVIAFIGAASLAVFGFFLKLFISGGGNNYSIISLAAAAVFLIVFFLQMFFTGRLLRANLIIFLECLALLGTFYDKISVRILIGFGLALFFLIWGNYSGEKELQNTLKINFWRISKSVLPKAFAAIAIFASIVFVGLNNDDFFISKENFQKIFVPSALIAQKFFPDFDPNLSINEIAVKMAQRQLEQIPQSQFLPKSVKTQMINQSVGEFENKISGFTGTSTSINTKVKLTEAVYELIKSEYLSLQEKERTFVFSGAVIFMFLAIEGFVWPVRLIITFLAYIIYEILIALGFAVVILEGKSKEVVVLK